MFRKCASLISVLSVTAAAQAAVQRRPSSTSHTFYYQVITFKKGGSELSQADRDELSALIQSIKDKKQKVEQAHLAVWSDKTFPQTVSLPQKDRSLAETRIATLEDELEEHLGIGNVESYNMAQRSSWFARAYSVSDKELQALFAVNGAPNNVTPDDFKIVKSKGGASKAVVLIELDPIL